MVSAATEMEFDVVVVGGGLTGTALALALARTPHRVAVLEPQPPAPPTDTWDTRIYAFSPGNVAWLTAMATATPVDESGHGRSLTPNPSPAGRGELRELAAPTSMLTDLGAWGLPLRAEPVRQMRIFGDAGGRLTLDALDAGLPELAWIAEGGRLQYALWQAAGAAGVTLIHGQAEAVAWGEAGHRLLLADGRRIAARLLVGADGAHSWLRRQAGIALDEEDYDQSGVVANFECERPHRGIAYQWFRRDGVLAWLPLPGRRISIVWSSRNADVPERLAWSPAELAEAVSAAGGRALGRLTPITAPAAFPLKRRRAREWVRPGLALIGDAAHSVHPLAGQGVNLGFRDARLLAAMLADGGNPGEPRRLQAYALRRVEDVSTMQFATGGLKKLFNNDLAALAWLRNRGLSLTDAQGWLKQALIRHAVL